jgi:hypothetical protein
MSLVVCSNKPQDGAEARNENSISKPWAFRNNLRSTYQIPENAQVALQSCKVNIPESVVVGGQNKFYQYLGQKVPAGGTIDDTTSWPTLVRLTDTDQFEDFSPQDFAKRVETRMRAGTYHPQFKEKTTVTRNISNSGVYEGYSIKYDQHLIADKVSGISTTDNSFKQWYVDIGKYATEPTTKFFTYTGSTSTFQRNASAEAYDICAGINIERPLSLADGELVVNVSDTTANANASGVEWYVGLSRWVNNPNGQNTWEPEYDVSKAGPEGFGEVDGSSVSPPSGMVHMDFGVGRCHEGKLIVFNRCRQANGAYGISEVSYWANTNSSYAGSGRFDLAAGPPGLKAAAAAPSINIQRVKFEVSNEQVALYLYDGTAYRLVTAFDINQPRASYFKPVSQSCWCLHPVLQIGAKSDGTNTSCTMTIRDFDTVPLTTYDPTVENGGGWYENNKLLGVEETSRLVDIRAMNGGQTNSGSGTYSYLSTSGTGINASPVLILGESNIYEPSHGANAGALLGFNKSVVEDPTTLAFPASTFTSSILPDPGSKNSFFVKLNNLGQDSVNAMVGNQSKILAHLTSFEDKTGKLTHDPATLVYLDLNNAAPLSVNEFDISFSYINEQYATVLTGQSIVCLVFRKKPKSLM